MQQPRYTKAGVIYKQDRDLLAEGWPETIPPGSDPADLHTGAASQAEPQKSNAKKGNL